jgi:hypothetical protein
MYIREFIHPAGGTGDREEDDPVVLG